MQSFIVLVAVLAVVHGNSLICRNYRTGSLIPNPENCAEFFMCRPGRAVKFTCPQFTLFNPIIQACDPTSAVVCKIGTLPVDIEYTPINALPSVIEHTNAICINRPVATLLPNIADCSRFYQCSPTGVIAFQCPAGTAFDSNRKYCERGDIASCQTMPELPVLPINPPTIPILPGVPQTDDQALLRCNGLREGTRIRHPSDCRRYIQCGSLNRSQIFTCAPGTAFDDVRMACDWERNVKCMRAD